MAVNNYVYSPQFPPLLKDGFFDINKQQNQLIGNIESATNQPNSAVWNDDSGHDHWQRYRTYPLIRRYQVWELTMKPFHYAVASTTTITKTTGYDLTHATTFAQTLSATVGAAGFGMSAEVTASLSLTTQDTESWHETSTVEQIVQFPAGSTFCMWTLYDTFEVNAQQWCQYEYRGDDPAGYSTEGDPMQSSFRMAIQFYQDTRADPANELTSNLAF